MNYYNEIDRFAAAWLRELIKAKHIPEGIVDERSIKEVQPGDLKGFTQCHFFAGIGGWSYALRLAGWRSDQPVWTGSCPCQPFSVAGKGKGAADERHLWPEFYRLIRQCRPVAIFGEQVAGKAGISWLDSVQADLEKEGYACGAVVFPACGVGAPHVRSRQYWMADTEGEGRCRREALAYTRDSEPGGPGEGVRPHTWPDRAGSQSNEAVSDILQASYGIPGRVGFLRGYGNAIVPQAAAEFIKSYLDLRGG